MGLGRKNTSSIKNTGSGDDPPPPPPPGGGGPQARQKLRVGESAGSAAALSGGNMISSPPPPPAKPAPAAKSAGSVLGRLANMDAGRAVRAVATGGLTEAPALARTVLDYAKSAKTKK